MEKYMVVIRHDGKTQAEFFDDCSVIELCINYLVWGIGRLEIYERKTGENGKESYCLLYA